MRECEAAGSTALGLRAPPALPPAVPGRPCPPPPAGCGLQLEAAAPARTRVADDEALGPQVRRAQHHRAKVVLRLAVVVAQRAQPLPRVRQHALSAAAAMGGGGAGLQAGAGSGPAGRR